MIFLYFTLLNSLTFAHVPPHLDLELNLEEYQELLKKQPIKKSQEDDPAIIKECLRLGERLSQLVNALNSQREETQQLRLSNPLMRRGIPIDRPDVYSPETVQKEYQELYSATPTELKDLLFGVGSFPQSLPTNDEDFLVVARRLSRLYETSARWKMLMPWLEYYKEAQAQDVRGFYFLREKGWTPAKLATEFAQLSTEEQKQVTEALKGICLNAQKEKTYCDTEITVETNPIRLSELFEEFTPLAQENWNTFFDIPDTAVRSDVFWDETKPELAKALFLRPREERFETYLKKNIEAEWKWGDWKLELDFGEYADSPRLRFEAGVTPHVNGLGGNEIVMDANEPIEEFSSQWTIRHEYGHVLGFPDCYHEFYDESLKAFVNYQLDTKDLMCSRAGDMNERLFLELKRKYFKRI